jgi:glycosyltransferase involved in cell wall biosynthesis
MKVAYLAPYMDGTGYSKSAIDHILSLDSVGVTVVPRSVKMTPTSGEVPQRIKELEENDTNNVDVVIQHNLPSEFQYKGGVQNVGIFAYETSNFRNSIWPQHLSLMDKIIVSCQYQKDAVEKSCPKSTVEKTHVLMHPVDCSKFDNDYELMDFDVPKNCVKFYTIAELGRRKNLPGLIAAYYTAFSSFDNVLLIIKTHLPGRNSEQATKAVMAICHDLKKSMGKFTDMDYYPRIALLVDYLSDSHINSLHCTGDVFVSASHGEAICLPMLDAMGFGNPVIAPNYSAFSEYSTDKDLLANTNETIVFGVNNAPQGLYTAGEKWGNISIPDLAYKMQYINDNLLDYTTDHKAFKEYRINGIKSLNYNTVGQELKDILNAN